MQQLQKLVAHDLLFVSIVDSANHMYARTDHFWPIPEALSWCRECSIRHRVGLKDTDRFTGVFMPRNLSEKAGNHQDLAVHLLDVGINGKFWQSETDCNADEVTTGSIRTSFKDTPLSVEDDASSTKRSLVVKLCWLTTQ